jgi:hypothetical protein
MKMNEMVFETDYSDDSLNLELVNEFFETNNEPTTNGRTYSGNTGGHSERYPHRFGLKEKKDTDCEFYDDNKILGWPTDSKKYWEGGNGTGWTRRGSDENY